MMVRLDEQRMRGAERLKLVTRKVEHHVGAAILSMRHDLVQEVLGGLRGQRTRNNQAIEVAGRVENAEELLLVLRGDRGARVQDAMLGLSVVEVGVDAGHAINPDGAAEAAHVHGLIDHVLAREASEEAERHGVDAELLEREGHVEALAVGGIARREGADVLVRNKRRAGNGHVDRGVSSQRIKHKTATILSY